MLVIHGGAGGDGPWKGMTSLDPSRISCMENVLSTVGKFLSEGMNALEAVTIAVEMMEDEPLFNAGKGSVLDENGKTLVSASSRDKDIADDKKTKIELSKLVGISVGSKAVKAGIEKIGFDRSGYLYHGRVKSLAEGAREAGLKF